MGFRSLARRFSVYACFLAAAMPAFAQQSPAPAEPAPTLQPAPSNAAPSSEQGTIKANYGAWSIMCDKPPGASAEQCVLTQNVIAEDRPEMGLSVVVLKTADRKARILRVLAPLGVLLPNGLGLNVDGKNIGSAYFFRCFSQGCYVEVIMQDDMLKTFRNGAQATFIVFQTPEEGIGIPVDLKGFADGYDALP